MTHIRKHCQFSGKNLNFTTQPGLAHVHLNTHSISWLPGPHLNASSHHCDCSGSMGQAHGSRRLLWGTSLLPKLRGKVLSASLRTWEGSREKRMIGNLDECLPRASC